MVAKIIVDGTERLGEISPLIFGTMLEHWGTPEKHVIYGGVWVGEESSIPNLHGLRKDVLEATKKMSPTIIRWPGGCPADVYHWLDGVGPREKRPVSLLASNYSRDVEETNQFGTHEFIHFCQQVGAQPYITVNVGTGTPEEAADWVEYCNREGRSKYSAMRVENGRSEPFGVQYWGIGNEINEDTEMGTMNADNYARVASEYSKLMKAVDPSIRTVAVGPVDANSHDDEWSSQVLKEAGSLIDYISIHKYYFHEDYYKLVASPIDAEKSFRRLTNLINVVTPKKSTLSIWYRRPERIKIAVDEWNVWHKEANPPASSLFAGYQKLTLQDGLFTAGMFHVMANPSNGVGMANICNLINSGPCGPIASNEETLYVNPQYLAFILYRNQIGDTVVRSVTDSDTYDVGEIGTGSESLISSMPAEMKELLESHLMESTDSEKKKIDNVPYLDCLATLDSQKRKLCLAVINRHKEQDMECAIDIRGIRTGRNGKIYELNAEEVTSANDFDSPNNVRINEKKLSSAGTRFSYVFPCHSVTVMELTSH